MSTGRPSVTDIQFSLDSSDSDDELHIKHLPSDSETVSLIFRKIKLTGIHILDHVLRIKINGG